MKYGFAQLDADLAEHIAATQQRTSNHTDVISNSSNANSLKSSCIHSGGTDISFSGGHQHQSSLPSVASTSASRRSSSIGASPLPIHFGQVEEEKDRNSNEIANQATIESRQSQQGSTPPHHVQQESSPELLMDPEGSPPGPPGHGPSPPQQPRPHAAAAARRVPPGRGGAAFPAPSASSPGGSLGSSGNGNGNGNGNGQPQLILIRQPPTHVIPNEWFELEVGLEFPPTAPSSTSSPGQEDEYIELVADLHAHNAPGLGPSPEPVSSGARLTIGGPGVIRVPLHPTRQPQQQRRVHIPASAKRARTARSSTKVLVRIDSHVQQDRLTQYSIKFTPKAGQHFSSTAVSSSSLQSQAIYARPIIMVSARLKVEAQDWEPMWYKDEGGREKCMTVRVTLCDKNGDPVRGRRVPIKFILLYDNGQSLRVMKQDILKVFGPPRQYINPDTSSLEVSFRIEDVSKNHQGMDFKVEMAPDSTRTASDIAPGFSPPVSVRSKRNKRQRSTGSMGGVRSTSAGSESFRELQMAATASTAASVASSAGPMGMPPQPSQPRSMAGVADVQALRAAMRGVIRWTEEVVNGLYPLKWQIIGYAQFPDGTVDYNRPYHSMPNPNDCISRVLSMYSDETRENLRTLLEAVENTTRSQGQGVEPSAAAASVASSSAHAAAAARTQQPQHAPAQPYPQYSAPGPGPGPYPYGPPFNQGEPSPWQAQQQYGYPSPSYPVQQGSLAQHPLMHPGPDQGGFGPVGASAGPILHPSPPAAAPSVAAASSFKQDPPSQQDVAAAASEAGTEASQDDIEYILAKQFKSVSTGDRLGFPCYDSEKDMIGFIRESSMKVGAGQFVPITNYSAEFGPKEMAQATRILNEAIMNNNPALHTKEAWGTVASLIDHAFVYDWSKDAHGGAGDGSNT